MGTRSIIAATANGKIRAIYCHWDGYINHTGALLLQHYNDPSAVDALINLGNISVLGQRCSPNDGEPHTFERPARGVTIAYHRDRGEEKQEAKEYDPGAFMFDPPDWGTEYWYLHDGDKWLVRHYSTNSWMSLDGATDDSIRS